MYKTILALVIGAAMVLSAGVASVTAAEGTMKIGIINIQEVLGKSKAGMEAQKTLESRGMELQTKFQVDQEALLALQAEIEKKSTVWNDDVRGEKEREYQKDLRDIQMKSEDAKYELKQLEKKIMEPILKVLNDVIAEVGQSQGYSVIFDNTLKGLRSRSGLLYAADSLDISDLVRNELDKNMAK